MSKNPEKQGKCECCDDDRIVGLYKTPSGLFACGSCMSDEQSYSAYSENAFGGD